MVNRSLRPKPYCPCGGKSVILEHNHAPDKGNRCSCRFLAGNVIANFPTVEYAPPMPQLDREIFVRLWKATKSQQRPEDPDLALFQKYMIMHEDMHAHFDRLEDDPTAPLDVDG